MSGPWSFLALASHSQKSARVEGWLTGSVVSCGMTDENDLLRALPLEDQLRIAAVDLALTRASRALAVACWRAANALEGPQV